MCYSAMVEQNAKKIGLRYKARIQRDMYSDLFVRRAKGEKILINKAMELPFLKDPKGPEEKAIAKAIEQYREGRIKELNDDLAAQEARLKGAEEALKKKVTKKAENDQRVATNKIKTFTRKLEELNTTKLTDSDSRIFPMQYVSMVYLDENGEKVVAPFRYHMRPNGEKESFDWEKNGCYNARFDNLKRVAFWKDSLEHRRGFILVKKFYENVPVENYKKKNKLPKEMIGRDNIVVCFDPDLPDYMILPTLWDKWTGKGKPSIFGAALITDDPNPEVAAAGHDRTPIVLDEEAAELWLNAKTADEAKDILLNHRVKTFFGHQVLGAA